MQKVIADLASKSPLGIVARSLAVESNLSDNPFLPDPLISIDDIRELRFALESSITSDEEENTDESARNVLTQASLLRGCLETLADQVNDIALGDVQILGSSGFPIDEVLEQSKDVLPPDYLETRVSSVTGTVELLWKPVTGAYSYQIYVTDQDPNEEGSWYPIGVTSKTKYLVNELEPARFYWFRLTAIGSEGESEKSRFARGIAA